MDTFDYHIKPTYSGHNGLEETNKKPNDASFVIVCRLEVGLSKMHINDRPAQRTNKQKQKKTQNMALQFPRKNAGKKQLCVH